MCFINLIFKIPAASGENFFGKFIPSFFSGFNPRLVSAMIDIREC